MALDKILAASIDNTISVNAASYTIGSSFVANTSSITTTSNTVTFGTAAYVVANGNVGFGTASPAGKVDIASTSTTQAVFRALNNGANWSQILCGYNGTSANYYDADTHIFRNGATQAERMRILSTGNILSLAGGSTTATGTGIAFPATQSASSDANTLDDYEEGTFTATITGMGSATNNNVTARYIKIGRVVTLYFPYSAYTTNAGSGASDVTVALPFPASSALSSSAALGLQSGGSASAGTHTNLYFPAGGSTALFYYDNATSWVRVTGSLLASSWNWAGNVVYLTDS